MRTSVGFVGVAWLLVVSGIGACTVSEPSPTVPEAGAATDASANADGALPADATPPFPDAAPDARPDADGSMDAGPLLAARTVADVPGLADFDFTATTLAVRVGKTLSTCALPGCAALTPVGNTNDHNGRFSIAGDRLYFSARTAGTIQDNVYSVAFDGTDLQNRTNHVVPGIVTESFLGAVSFAGGLTKVEQVVSWARSGEAGYRTLVQTTAGASGNPHRVGRTTANTHENHGSLVRYFPEQMRFVNTENNPTRALTPPELTVTGATVPAPATNPTAIGTTPRGAGAPHPMVVIREGGTLKACPTVTDCAAWIDLGPLGEHFALDGKNLYVAGASGLSRCSLEEISTRGTCTPKPMLPRELVQPPLLLTETEVYYRSGTRVRAVPKTMGAACPPGTAAPLAGGACAPCSPGEEPSPTTGACRACPRGTYSGTAGDVMCRPCSNGQTTAATGNTSVAACVACPANQTSSARTDHLCAPITSRRMFLTAESHDGNFGGDANLTGATPIQKADDFCARSAARPDSSTYKAFLVDGTLRDAVTQTDWVLRPNSTYVQVDGTSVVGTTTSDAIFTFPLMNPLALGTLASDDNYFTGINATTFAAGAGRTCEGWTTGSPAVANMGRLVTSSVAVGVGLGANCGIKLRLVCVEQ